MNAHALEVLDVRGALALVAERAASPLGRAAVLALRPSADREKVAEELSRVAEWMAFAEAHPGWGPPPIPDAHPSLDRLAVEGAVLDPEELHRIGVLLTAARVIDEALSASDAGPSRAALRARLVCDSELEAAVTRTVDAHGAVLDTASKELRRIRAALRATHGRIVRALEGYVATLPERFVVDDASVTVREGRYVIPLRREGRTHVGGVIHDESGTGATIFVEPPVAVDAMNDLRDLERDERREVQRILRAFSAQLHPRRSELTDTLTALVDFDSLHARARAALAWRAYPPDVVAADGGVLRLVGARHPVLLARGVEVVPYDLEMEPDERTLVVSGPNTGGKSVFLKAVGLLAVLVQSGVIPPVGKGTVLPVFSDVFADIGDEQSIAESLSTFSAHLERLREILDGADAGSLVLMDEMGTGTDPTEGAALARAILEALTRRAVTTIVTSHLGALKTLDAEVNGVVNASLQFDPERMQPTYRLTKGLPGRSYGLAIARRLAFPEPVLSRAEALIDDGAASLEDVLERLETQEREARRRVDALRGRDEELRKRESDVTRLEADLETRERTAERRAREQARQLLLDAREEVEDAIRTVRAAAGSGVEEAARQARRSVEEAARSHVGPEPGATPKPRAGDGAITEGRRVRLPGGSSKGIVVEMRESRAVVEVGGLRMELPTSDLEVIEGAAPARSGPEERGWSGTVPDAAPEIDLRGLRVDEVALELGRGLDAAILGGLGELRVIHGKGTGAVRARVQELLRDERRVTEYRAGAPGEGGAGVTVVRFG